MAIGEPAENSRQACGGARGLINQLICKHVCSGCLLRKLGPGREGRGGGGKDRARFDPHQLSEANTLAGQTARRRSASEAWHAALLSSTPSKVL